MVAIKVTVDPENKFRAYIRGVVTEIKDLRFSMGEGARIIKKGSTANFILKGSGRYVPLSPKYKARKQILAPGAPILVGAKKGRTKDGALLSGGGRSGRLRDSIIKTTGDSIIKIDKLSFEVGTSVTSKKGFAYGKAVQVGTSKMPARPYLLLTDPLVKQIVNTIDDEIMSILGT